MVAFVLFSSCAVGLLRLQMAYASPYTDINVATAYDMITGGLYPDLVVLDVRTKGEYDGGHIYGAVWIPVNELDARIGELAGHENHEIIVYCGSGVRSVTASETLDSHNFTKVYNMLGGITAWRYAGYPVWIATVHNVDTTFNYDTIQTAIDAPQTLDGHTILVDAGTYYEHVVANKSVAITGESTSNTIVNGSATGTVFHVIANNVNISKFWIFNGKDMTPDCYGIFLNNTFGCHITDNKIHAVYGIDIYRGSNNTVSNNIIGMTEEIYVLQNIIISNSSDNVVSGNGLAAYSSCITLAAGSSRNYIYDNSMWAWARTLLFMDSNENYLLRNWIECHWGMTLFDMLNSSNNIFYHNVFYGETEFCHVDEYSLNNTWDDGYPSGGNHWIFYASVDEKRGPDQDQLGSDGIGDTPCTINANNTDRYPLMKPYGGPHDIGIRNVTTSESIVYQGLHINMTIINYGIFTENFNVTAYANTTVIATFENITLTSRNSTTITFTWNTTSIAKGDYTISANASVVPGETDTSDNTNFDGVVTLLSLGHDVAVRGVIPSKTVVGQGYSLSINVVARNYGSFSETFNVTVYANTTLIGTQKVNNMPPNGTFTILTFTWNTTGFARGLYTISANATILPNGTYTGDNSYTDGTVKVTMPGDVAPDFGVVNIVDIVYVAIHFDAKKGEPDYEPNADINDDATINIVDVVIAALNFDETYPFP